MLIKKKVTRREIFERFGGAVAASAFLPLVPRLEAAEGDSNICRFSYWHECVMPARNIVNGNYQAAPGPLVFRNDYAPLNEMRDKVIFVRNMRRPQGEGAGQGPHPFGAQGIAGWRGRNRNNYVNEATSLDQFFAEKLAGKTPFSNLRPGLRNKSTAGAVDTSTSVIKGQPQPRYASPTAMYNDIFKAVPTGGGNNNGGSNEKAELLRRRKSILDYMRSDIDRVSAKVSQLDRERIEAHNTSIRATEQKLEALYGGNGNSNNSPAECNFSQPGNSDKENVVYPLYSSLLTQAFTCDVTRVGGMNFGGTTNLLKYDFLPQFSGGNWHSATHGKSNGPAYLHAVLKFRTEEVTKYLKKLDAVIEPNGKTLLDNTAFVWLTDVARDHDRTNDIHCVFAGATSRFKGHGRMINVGNNDSYNQLQTSIAHFMGYEVEVYGDPNYGGKGVLSSDLFT